MKKTILYLLIVFAPFTQSCNSNKPHEEKPANTEAADQAFAAFEDRFLDAYWKQYPSGAIYAGYGKYYDRMIVPDSTTFASNILFSKSWLDSLEHISYNELGENNKISLNIIKNQLESDHWYTTVFKSQEWDASMYNISGNCDYLINQPYAPLDTRLKTLSSYLENATSYYAAAVSNLNKPTKVHLELAILQNEAGVSVLGTGLADSIKSSTLSEAEQQQLRKNIVLAVDAMKNYAKALKKINADKTIEFRDFRIGEKLFTEKFKYDLATDLTPAEVYAKAKADLKYHHNHMYAKADSVWSKYYKNEKKPSDSLQLIQMVLNKIQLDHATPEGFYDSINNQVTALKKFIVEKDLFDIDTATFPVKVRYMPEYARGVTTASAEFIPPYQKQGTTWYNIDDLTLYPKDKAESALREENTYASQILSIHEAIPGHCLQGIYNIRKSPDVLRSVFQNGAMIEGWAVYCEDMMIENGWGNHSAEIELALGVWKLRELANVIIDYDIQCRNVSEEEITKLLHVDCFQTSAQVQEKYHRATLSQVQLCSYYTGATAIKSLREEYKKKMGDSYSLKNFHETFLSFGSSPVKYIRERMLK